MSDVFRALVLDKKNHVGRFDAEGVYVHPVCDKHKTFNSDSSFTKRSATGVGVTYLRPTKPKIISFIR